MKTLQQVTFIPLLIPIGEILRELLPPEVDEVPSGFETVGDIAHMNLLGK